MDVNTMPAGREMDALIAEKIFGLKVEWEQEYLGEQIPSSKQLADRYDENGILPQYSTYIAAAWQVHRHCCKWIFSKRRAYLGALTECVRTRIGQPVAYPDLMIFLEPIDFCRAALKAKGE